MHYSELFCLSNFSFLIGASHPQELVARAHALGYEAIALTDECSLAGIVKAYVEAKKRGIHLIVGSHFRLREGLTLIALAPTREAYSELSGFITLARRRADKGHYEAHFDDLRFRLRHCLIIWLADRDSQGSAHYAEPLQRAFTQRLWLGIQHQFGAGEQARFLQWQDIARQHGIPMVAVGGVLMHDKSRKPLQDILTAIRENTPLDQLGTRLQSNAEAVLKPLHELAELYPPALLRESLRISARCTFSMETLRYQYPEELVPSGTTPIAYLRQLVAAGAQKRWPEGAPKAVLTLLEKELQLIEELKYEFYFLTVHDIVRFARSQNILCQGRGSAANSVVCYCLHITEIAPGQINVLFERFISRERDEPPDIDVDFEHQRREEVIQYIYQKYSRERAALAATVITYRSRSAIRDVGKALGLPPDVVDQLAKSLAWWDRTRDLHKRIAEAGWQQHQDKVQQLFFLVEQILGFPRHLSQHVGGFIIAQGKVSELVPVENASMAERTVIQWDKEDLEAMGLLKVDVLALGMLTALRKALSYVGTYTPEIQALADIPKEDPATYAMLSRGDSIGVFQVESRAQMSMLPRLQPKTFYDLVIEIAIVRPGPIQGDMVHPYLRRRDGLEPVLYENDALREVLAPTLGVPIFQEQAIRLAMVAAGFSGGEADQLRRAMASWGKNGNLLTFETRFIQGMLGNGYSEDFAQRLFSQIKGFGGYGFPESHSASFALLCYFSSWLKCHHPAAFYCALLNSQPMGFYSPAQLIQDAQRHQVSIYPLDVNKSAVDTQLECLPGRSGRGARDFAMRLGLTQIKSLSLQAAERIVAARREGEFHSLAELATRAKLEASELQHLAAADALHALSGHRYRAHWRASAIKPALPLFNEHESSTSPGTPPPTMAHNIAWDYTTTNVSLRPHPMVLLRQQKPFQGCTKQSALHTLGNGRFVRVAGLVTGRQRPGTAKGTVFLTLEDETGNINVIVWKHTQEHYRQALLNAQVLIVKGRLEMQHGVMHIIAGHLLDMSSALEGFAIKSRDFH